MSISITADVTFTANADTTTVSDPRIGAGSFLILMPLTQNAGLAEYYFSGQSAGQCTITHANNAQTDREFRLLILV